LETLTLKRQCHEIFCFWFFHESVSPQPQSIPLGPFQIFSKIRGDIRKSRCTTVSTTPAADFATNFTSFIDTGGKFATSVNDTGGKFVNDTGGKQCKLEGKNLYIVNSTIQRCPNKIIKIFLIKKFFSIRNDPNGIFRGLGEADS
jgi:hypothetical protein